MNIIKNNNKADLLLFLILFSYALMSVLLIHFFNGTGREADSINHYLHARYALDHPELLLNHWAKPLFTLLALPFAQLGFDGIKVFNALCSLFSLYFIFRIAQKLNWKKPSLATLFYVLFPLSFMTSYSGFTEPLFALVFIISIYLIKQDRYSSAALLISFSPFIRSEGLIILGVFFLFFLFVKKIKQLPLLLFGHMVYALIGMTYFNDFLWVFNKIPYAAWSSPYGEGDFFHFFEQLNYGLGIPLYALFWIGFILLSYQWLKNKREHLVEGLMLLSFTTFFLAHSLFWELGIFNSMGLKRVFAAITPTLALISLYGFNQVGKLLKHPYHKGLQAIILLYIIVFPFTSNPAAIDWQKEMNLTLAQQNAKEVAEYIKSQYPDRRIIYADPFIPHALNIDPFDQEEALTISEEAINHLATRDIIVWDNWHAKVDQRIHQADIESSKAIITIKRFQKSDSKKQSEYVLYQKKPKR